MRTDLAHSHTLMHAKKQSPTTKQIEVVIRRNYLHYVPKYQRYEKRHKNVKAHISPCFHFQLGDEAIVGECRSVATFSPPFRF